MYGTTGTFMEKKERRILGERIDPDWDRDLAQAAGAWHAERERAHGWTPARHARMTLLTKPLRRAAWPVT